MPSVSHTEPVGAPADAVWRLVGDFANDSWTGVAIRCEGTGTGAVRTVAMPTGDVVERCDHHDDDARSLAYTVVSGNPFPVTSCTGRVQVVEADDGRSEVHWTISYETDADPADVARDLRGLLQASAGALRDAAEAPGTDHVPVTYDRCDHVEGPFFHGTRYRFDPGDHIVAGRGSNYHDGRISNHVYFAALLEPAVWGAELAVALGGDAGRGHIYVVEPTGPFEDDPNVTNKRFPGNVTQSYRSRDPLLVVRELESWEGHPPEVLQGMLDNLARLREQGLDVIED